MNLFETFLKLHQGPTPLLLANIWDVHSAKLFEASGYKAIGTSSQAVATSLGYEDGEKLPFDSLLQLAKRVVQSVSIPFMVDIEGGYSRSVNGIIENIKKLHDAGVAGINLEDTVAGTSRTLQAAGEFQKILSAVADHISRNNWKLFVNVRTDAFLLGMPAALSETLTRISIYKDSGAEGIFVPCITNKEDISAVVRSTDLPINVMCMPGLPDFDALASLGVKRISMGPFFFNKVYNSIGTISKAINSQGNFSSILL
jgi:2-methylisocitrate lyase-like PEP mutase family enzyme